MDTDSPNRTGRSLINIALGVSPLAVAGYFASKNMKLKDFTSLTETNPIHGLGQDLGKSAQQLALESIANTTEKATDVKEFIGKAINESEVLKKIMGNESNRKSTLQALLLSLDDPAWGIDDVKKQDLKSKLMSVAEGTDSTADDLVREVFGAMKSYAPDSTMADFAKNRSNYSKFGKSLTTPTVDIPAINTPYNPISLANSSKEGGYVERIRKALGNNYLVEPHSYTEFGMEHPVARISRITTAGLQHKANIPLRATGYYRSGATGRTLYSMVKATMDAGVAHNILDQGNAAQLMSSNAINTVPDYLVRDLERRAGNNNLVWGDINSNLRKLTSNVPRIGMGSDLYGTHVRWQARQPMQGVSIQNLGVLDPLQRKETIAKLGAKLPKIFDLDISNKRLLAGTGRDLSGFVAFNQGSILQKYQRTYGGDFNRNYLPITARAHQVGGRTAAVLPSKGGTGARRIGGMTVGSFLDMAGTDLGGATDEKSISKALRGTSFLGEHATGGFGSIAFIDFNAEGGINEGLGGLGQGFMGKKQRVRKAFDMTILDPDVHKYLSSDLLDEVMATGDQGMYIPAQRLRENTPIGRTAEEMKKLPWNSETEGLFLKINRVTKEEVGEGFVKSLSFAGYSEEEVEMLKVFGRDHKGNLVYDQDVLGNLGKNKMLANQALNHIGFGAEDSIVVTSDMMKKATGYLHGAIGDSAVMLGKGSITHENLRTTAANLAKAGTKGHLEAYTEAALKLMHTNNVPVELMGTVFSGVYADSMKQTMAGPKAHLIHIAESLFGKKSAEYAAFTSGAESGMMMTHAVKTVADSVNDWGQGIAGVEPRFAKTYFERLMASGMSKEQAGKSVANLYKNRMGLTKSYEFTSHMLDTMSYLTGTSSAHKSLFESKPKFTWQQITGEMLSSNNKDNSLLEVLKRHDNGAIINFDDAPESIRRAAKEIFGQGEVALPGKLAHDAARGTQIKVGGQGTIAVDAELGRLTNEFQELIQTISSNPVNVREGFKNWKGKYTDLFTRSIDSLAGGKIMGGTSPEIAFYDMSGKTGLLRENPKMKARAWELQQASHGQAIWQTSEGFMSQLSDMGDKNDRARKAEMFFTSAEQTERNMQRGIFGVEARHPIMSTGNVALSQRYRHLGELESLGGKDEFFLKFRNSSQGKGMLRSHYGLSDDAISQTSSFHALWQRNGDKKVRREFFKDFVSNMSDWTSGRQADRMFYGNIETSAGNLSILNAGFADADGDNSISFMLGGEDARSMNKLVGNQAIETTGRDFRVRGVFNLINAETKKALDNIKEKYKASGKVEDTIYNDVIKEMNVSTNTGPLDANLRPLHEASMMYAEGGVGSDASVNARLFLSNLQENFVIKSKKIPVESGISDRVIAASRNLHQYDNKVYQDEFRALMHELYAGTDFAKGKISMPDIMAKNAADQPMLDKLLGGQIKGAETSLDEILDTIMSTMSKAHAGGTSQGLTKGTLNQLLEHDPLRAMNLLEGSDSFISGMLSGFKGQDTGAMVINNLGKAKRILGSVSNKNLGLMIGGVAASAAMFSMSRDFTGPQPLIMPGEMPSSSLVSKIQSSRFLESDPTIEPEQLAFSGAPNNNFPVINQRQTYLDRPNSYQIRGETSSPNGLNTFSNYFSSLTNYQGRGFIRMNDTRRPITENYIDRLMGES